MIAPLGIENRKVSLMAAVWLVIIICSTLSYSLKDRTQYASLGVQNGAYVPPPPGADWSTGGATQPGTKSESTAQSVRSDFIVETYLVQEQAEQECDEVAQNIECKVWPAFGAYSETYEGLSSFSSNDIPTNLLANLEQILLYWIVVPFLEPFCDVQLFNQLFSSDIKQLLCLHLVILSSFAFVLRHRRTRS